MTSYSDDLEEQLRQNFKLRRELGAAAANAQAVISAKQGDQRPVGSASAAETTSGNDDLEGLRRELKLRRELGVRGRQDAE
jgi:hypothetical protein